MIDRSILSKILNILNAISGDVSLIKYILNIDQKVGLGRDTDSRKDKIFNLVKYDNHDKSSFERSLRACNIVLLSLS